MVKGILLAGGTGSRLFPVTSVVNKHLLPIFDKPMIYYALTSLISASIREICLVCNDDDLIRYKKLLGDGSEFGISIEYITQAMPQGIAQALSLASAFIGEDNVSVILGDNVFVDHGDIRKNVAYFKSGAHIFDRYFSQYAASVDVSDRGECEIIDLLKRYMDKDHVKVSLLNRGVGWIDAATSKNHAIVSRCIEAKQQMHRVMIGSPHEAADVRGFIDDAQLLAFAKSIKSYKYSNYFESLILYAPTLRN